VRLYGEDKLHLKSYHQTLEHLAAIAWAYAGKHMSQLPEIAKEVTKQEVARGIRPATIRNRLACLKAACRHAWKAHGLTAADPTARMQMPEVRNERQVYASRAEMLRIAAAADRHDVRILIRVLFYTGMRLGEVLRVEVRDGVLVLQDTKNGDLRAVPAHPKIATCLDYLPLATVKRTLQAGFMRARKAAGLEHVRIHDLRHSAASEMVNAGVPLHTVGEVLGHRDARSTKRYSHHRQDTLAAAVRMIGSKRQTA
jgi:integrase